MKQIAAIALSFILILAVAPATQGQTDSIKSEMRFDLGITRDLNINLWPVFKRYKTKESNEVQLIFPLFKYKRNYLAPSKHSHLFPVYWSDSSAGGKDFRFLSLYYPSIVRTSKDYIRNVRSFKFVELAPEINFVEITKSSDGLFVQNNMLFMLWFKNDLALHKSHFILFPVYWSFKNPSYSTSTIFPFTSWGTYNQNKENYFAITPLYWHFQKTDGYRNALFPLWWNRKRGLGDNATYTNLFVPVYWSLRDKARSNKVLFPIMWKFKNSSTSSFTLAPLLSWGKSFNNSNSYLVVTPAFWHFKRGSATSNILFPLWWNRKRGSGNDAVSSTLVLPVYWSHMDRLKDNKILFSIVWRLKNPNYHSFTVAPLLSTGYSTDSTRKHLMVTPLIWHFKNGETTRNVAFPIWWYKRIGQGDYAYRSDIIVPFYLRFGDNIQKTQILFPFIWNLKNENYSSFTFAPLFSTGRSDNDAIGHFMVTPLFWNIRNGDSNSNLLFPIWWYTHKGSGDNQICTNILFPLYFRFRDKANDNTILFPIHWRLKNPRYSSYTFFPLYSKGGSVNGVKAHLMVTPLYWRFVSGENRKTILFPLWLNRHNGSGDNGNTFKVIFPFYWAYKDKAKDNEILFPIIWSLKDAHYNKLIIAPFFSHGYSPDKKYGYLMVTPLYWHFKMGEGYRNILFPLWWNKKRGADDNIVYSNLFIPVYWAKKDKHKDNRVAFPIIWNLRNQHYSSFTVAPFFSRGISSDSCTNHLTITPIFWQFRNGVDYRIILFPIWWNIKQGIGKKEVNNKVAFPIYWNLNNEMYSSITVAPFFSTGHSTDNSRSHLMLSPLFWHRNDGYKSSNVLFPIWWNSKQGTADNPRTANFVLPLFWSVRDKETENTVLFPILWNFKNSNYSSSTLFPLISFGHTPDGTWRHFVAMPLFWSIIKGDDQDRVLFPLWWNRKRGSDEDATSSTIILPVYWSYKDHDKDNDYVFPLIWSLKNANYQSFTFAPLFSFGHSAEKRRDHIVVNPFFWHFKNAYSYHNILLPIYWNSKRGIGEQARYTNILFPLYLSFRDAKKNNRILFPIAWTFKNSKYSSASLLPLYSYGHSPDSSKRHLAITPLYWRISRPEYTRVVFFPFFSRYTDTTGKSKYSSFVFVVRSRKEKERKTISLIWPICEYTKAVNYRYFRFAPIIWYKKSPASRYFSIQPLYLQSSDSLSRNYYFLWQLYSHKNYFNEKVSRSILWKAIIWDRYYNKDFEFRILYLLYANVKKHGNIERTLFPLYQYTHQQNGNKSVALLFYFYSSLRRKIPETKEYYQEQRIFWFIRLRSNYKVLKEKGIKESWIKQ